MVKGSRVGSKPPPQVGAWGSTGGAKPLHGEGGRQGGLGEGQAYTSNILCEKLNVDSNAKKITGYQNAS